MEKEQLLNRIRALEEELQAIKRSIEPQTESPGILRLKQTSNFLLSYWPLLSLLFGIVVIAYVQLVYGVDYFESYRAVSTTRNLSAFYSQLGDKLLTKQEWEAAEDAYTRALEIDKNNVQATYGMVKAQVFQPLEGQKYYAPEVADTKLDYLFEKFPNDHLVHFLSGMHAFYQGDYANAPARLNKALVLVKELEEKVLAEDREKEEREKELEKIHDIAAGYYVALGYVSQTNYDIEAACAHYNTALELAPENPFANNNVSICDMLNLNFDAAIDHLETARANSVMLGTYINLGDAYLFAGDAQQALAWQQYVLRTVEDTSIENERYVAGEWTYPFMPVEWDEINEQIKGKYVKVANLTQKKILMHYNLSFGHALNGDLDSATKEFNQANQLDVHKDFNVFFSYKIQSIRDYVTMNDEIQLWFETHQDILATS